MYKYFRQLKTASRYWGQNAPPSLYKTFQQTLYSRPNEYALLDVCPLQINMSELHVENWK